MMSRWQRIAYWFWMISSVVVPVLTVVQGYLVIGHGEKGTVPILALCAMCLTCGELFGWWLGVWRRKLDTAPDG
jgi:hypothetical protein